MDSRSPFSQNDCGTEDSVSHHDAANSRDLGNIQLTGASPLMELPQTAVLETGNLLPSNHSDDRKASNDAFQILHESFIVMA